MTNDVFQADTMAQHSLALRYAMSSNTFRDVVRGRFTKGKNFHVGVGAFHEVLGDRGGTQKPDPNYNAVTPSKRRRSSRQTQVGSPAPTTYGQPQSLPVPSGTGYSGLPPRGYVAPAVQYQQTVVYGPFSHNQVSSHPPQTQYLQQSLPQPTGYGQRQFQDTYAGQAVLQTQHQQDPWHQSAPPVMPISQSNTLPASFTLSQQPGQQNNLFPHGMMSPSPPSTRPLTPAYTMPVTSTNPSQSWNSYGSPAANPGGYGYPSPPSTAGQLQRSATLLTPPADAWQQQESYGYYEAESTTTRSFFAKDCSECGTTLISLPK